MCARRSRHCRNSTATTPCSGPGSPPARRAGFRCAKTQARSPKTRRAFCRTPSSDSSLTALPVATCVLLLCKAPAGPTKRAPAIPPVLKIVALVVFAQTLFTRAVDPVIPMIAADLAIDVKTAALLSTAFTLPYALVQPALGVIADFLGKTRMMNICVLIVAVTSLACAVAASFSFLVAMRVAAGLVAGGVFPVAMALLGDLVPVNQRQIAIARLLGVALTANVLGASVAGVIGDLFGWRGVFAVLGLFALGV